MRATGKLSPVTPSMVAHPSNLDVSEAAAYPGGRSSVVPPHQSPSRTASMASTPAPTRIVHLRITCPRLAAHMGAPTEFGVQGRQNQIQSGQFTADGLLE